MTTREARGRKAGAALLGLVLLLTSCGVGTTLPPEQVSDVSANLSGSVRSTTTGTTSWWFEYGTSTSYGQSTPHRPAQITDVSRGIGVSQSVTTRTVDAPATTCPAATDADFPGFTIGSVPVPPVVTRGDFVVHDHPAAG